MSQLSGAFSVELDLDRLAEEIAVRVAGALHEMRNGETYGRDAGPAPDAGSRRGARFGAVTDDGIDYDQAGGA